MSKIMICGSLLWKDGDYIRKILSRLNKTDTVIHGKLSGVDQWVNFYAQLIPLAQWVINPPVFEDSYSERLYTIYTKCKPNKILIVDNEYECSEMYKFLDYIDKDTTEIVVIKSIMFR